MVKDLKALEVHAKILKNNLSIRTISPLKNNESLSAEFQNLLYVAQNVLPDHQKLYSVSCEEVEKGNLSVGGAYDIVIHMLQLIKIEKKVRKSIREGKVFDSADEKIKQAGLAFKKGDFSSTFHCLNTAFELVLKDKIGIPTTITGINTSNIVELLVKHKVEPYLYFKEVKKRVTEIDNKIKHQGYTPSKIDAINGIKAMEELISKLRNKEIKLTDEVKNKICEGL